MFDQATRNAFADDSDRRVAVIVPLAAFILTAALLVYGFWDMLLQMTGQWNREEYSYAYLIPVLVLLMVWQTWEKVETVRRSASWLGTVVVAVGLLLLFVGELGTVYTVGQYAFLITLTGLIMAYLGVPAMRYLWVPLVYLAFIVPLPNFLYAGLSAQLQLISSALGTAMIRLFGISVYLSGNVIDLGTYKLQVVEACSGLRYLFPLMSFGFLAAYLYKGPVWQKVILFVSTVPITVVMNSIRIAIIGLLVDNWGIAMAEGFLHDFEGWVVFLACVTVLFLEAWFLMRLTGRTGPLRDYFRVDLPKFQPRQLFAKRARAMPRAYAGAICLLMVVSLITSFFDARSENIPDRQSFVTFPYRVGDWEGRKIGLEAKYQSVLKLDDYILANYVKETGRSPVNLYISWYDSQRKGQSAHSPSSCIPGDGWEIQSFERQTVPLGSTKRALSVNRAVISKGQHTQLVYYWFPQRGRDLTNEYLVKWYLFWDSVTRNRTDGAMVRLITPIQGEDFASGDARLTTFLQTIHPYLVSYVPG